MRRIFLLIVVAVIVVGCAVSPTGRRQLMLFPDSEMDAMGAAAFAQIREEMPESDNTQVNAYVQCVADAVVAELDEDQAWDVVVFQEESANAFALPGGRIGVHTGLLDVAENQHQLATVIGHEIGHILAEHSNERVSTAFATESGLRLIEALAGESTTRNQQLMGLLGLGAQVGVLMPFSRVQESEADAIGLELMARAGFDPRESVLLWENMAAGGEQPPEFLSTHPAPQSRIQELAGMLDEAMVYYREARAKGLDPQCTPLGNE